MEPNTQKIESLVRQLLVELGEDPEREGLREDPARVAKALAFLTQGYRTELGTVINQALFTQTTSGMVIVKDIEALQPLRATCCRSSAAATSATFERQGVRREQARAAGGRYARRLQLQEPSPTRSRRSSWSRSATRRAWA
jgi:GTP cyclohydrolase I